MSLAENVAAAIVVFILVLVITIIIYGGLSSTKYFGRIMFRNKQAEREFRQRQQGGQVLERLQAIEQQMLSNPGGGGGGNVMNQASQTSEVSHRNEQQQTKESQQQQTEETQQEQTAEASQVTETPAPTPTSSNVAEVGRKCKCLS